ncbi:MAG: YihY/virulence factor BrkB family protein [Geminicoccaceae bacterium]
MIDREQSLASGGAEMKAGVFGRLASSLWHGLLHMLDDGGTLLAGHIAFAGLFALFPFLIFLTTLAGEFGQSAAAQDFIELGLGTMPDQVRAAIEPPVREVLRGGRQGLMTLSILASLWAVSSAFEAARYALNLAYGVTQTRAIWRQRLQSLVMVMIFAVMIIAAMLLAVAAPIAWTLVEFLEITPIDWRPLYGVVRFGLSVILMLGFVVPLYRWLPNRKLSTAEVIPGAILAVLVWIGSAGLYSWYLINLGRFTVTYGSLGGVVATLLFFYISALIFIFGAEVNAAARRLRVRSSTSVS